MELEVVLSSLIELGKKNQGFVYSSDVLKYCNEDSDDYDTIDLKNTIRQEKDVHEKLLNETNQMKAQMDEYEDNLTDVSDKMQHTTRILNFVLVVLIFALLVVLGVVAYMVLLNKGTI